MCNKKDRSQGSFSRRDSKGNGFPRSLVAVRGAGGGGGGGEGGRWLQCGSEAHCILDRAYERRSPLPYSSLIQKAIHLLL